MSPSKPPWWRAFDKVERSVGSRLEAAAASNRYVDVMVRGMKLQRATVGNIGRVAGGAADKVLGVVNIPTRSDIRRINRQLAALTSEVRSLSTEQREALAPPVGVTDRSGGGKRRASRPGPQPKASDAHEPQPKAPGAQPKEPDDVG